MPTEKIFQFTKDATIPVSLALLASLVAGVWFLAVEVSRWRAKLDSFEQNQRAMWTYNMEKDLMGQLKYLNPTLTIPNIGEIRTDNLAGN